MTSVLLVKLIAEKNFHNSLFSLSYVQNLYSQNAVSHTSLYGLVVYLISVMEHEGL